MPNNCWTYSGRTASWGSKLFQNRSLYLRLLFFASRKQQKTRKTSKTSPLRRPGHAGWSTGATYLQRSISRPVGDRSNSPQRAIVAPQEVAGARKGQFGGQIPMQCRCNFCASLVLPQLTLVKNNTHMFHRVSGPL